MEQKTEASQAVDELLPCPFCGAPARIESNRDWHKLRADHDESCVFDPDDYDLMYPAQPGYLLEIAQVWNRRAALKAQPAPTEAAQGEDSARLDAERLPSMNPACGCEACNPQMIGWMMFICKLCGDKRCPHVANHVNPCQGRARASAETGGVKS